MNRVMFTAGGAILVCFGFGIILRPSFYDRVWLHQWDLTEIKWPLGIVFMAIGLLLIWSAQRKKGITSTDGFYICPRCEATYRKGEISEKTCPKCKVNLEELKGFYEKS